MPKRKSKSRERDVPTCVFCGASYGAEFAMFNPRFKPFGTACVQCEESLPADAVIPGTPVDAAAAPAR